MARYLVGIDLGTTNSALAYIDSQAGKGRSGAAEIHKFPVPQLVAPGEVGTRPLLPSFLYLPGPHDLPAGATALPWDPLASRVVGEFGRNHGARIPGRLVTSAKSWLCHAGVDRSAPLLPWSAPPDVPRISPVKASASYLRHLVDSWNYAVARGQDPLRLEQQTVVLTVPASFDDVARTLTVEAAKKAGLENVTLLEEPQAAFYCWLATHPPQEAAQLKPGYLCLVVDVGGGTTDFSLIQAVEQQGELGFVRLAVGDHLLLGGDNMDLALAKYVEAKLPGAGRLDAAQYGLLTQACRQAKESLLGPAAPATYSVAVMGRGRQVIGGSLNATLSASDVRHVILDGFLPMVARDALPQRGARVGLHEMGLPYVGDPAITRHLAAFLKQHQAESSAASPEAGGRESLDHAPQAVLFNGGVFQPAMLRERVVGVLRDWFGGTGQIYDPLVLTNPSLDLAVAWGAAHFAWLRHSGGKRIGGGIARSYYIGVGSPEAQLVETGPLTVVCVVPQHLEEGQEIALEKPELELALGQPVAFPLYTSTVRGEDAPGAVLHVQPEQLLQLPPLHTVLRGGKRSGAKHVPVTLAARSTEIGTLELFCVAREGSNRWRLEFNVRDIVKDSSAEAGGQEDDEGNKTVTDVWPELAVQEAARLIRAAYAEGAAETEPQGLTKALETALDAGRNHWPTGLCRRLWEFLAEVAEHRRRSPAHLSRWYHLAGFVLRPGFGDPGDRFRVEQLWKLINAPPKMEQGRKTAAPLTRAAEGGADFWIMWRRVAGGLNAPLQANLYNRLRPALLPAKTKATAKPPSNELAEMWRTVASLERLDVKHKEQLGAALLKPLKRSPAPTYGFFALTRFGARKLFYGPLNAVAHPEIVQQWLDAVLAFEPGHQSERAAWLFCLAQLARRSGQRALDVDDGHQTAVLTVLRGQAAPARLIRVVEEVVDLAGEEQSELFGESLPIGLRLVPD